MLGKRSTKSTKSSSSGRGTTAARSSMGSTSGTKRNTSARAGSDPIKKKKTIPSGLGKGTAATTKISAAFVAASMASKPVDRPTKSSPANTTEDNAQDLDEDDNSITEIVEDSAKGNSTTPEAALSLAIERWERAQKDKADQDKAEKDGTTWEPAPGRAASTIYLRYSKPYIGVDNRGASCIVFPCKCCRPSTAVVRPFDSTSTSNLNTHIRTKSGKLEQVSILTMLAKKAQAPPTTAIPIAPAVCRQLSVAWTTASARPLAIIEDEGFLAFLSEEQRAAMPSRRMLSRDIERVYNGMVQHFKLELKQVVGALHLAIDLWTSSNGFAFLGLILCYQKDGVAIRRQLDMVPFLSQHTAKNLATATLDTLRKYEIEDRIWNITSDNASENSLMMTILAELGGLPRFKETTSTCRVRCSAHVLNLVSQAVLKGFKPKRKEKDNEPTEAEVDWTDDIVPSGGSEIADEYGANDEDNNAAAEEDESEEEESSSDEDDELSDEKRGDTSRKGKEKNRNESRRALQKLLKQKNERGPPELDGDAAISTALQPKDAAVAEDEEELERIFAANTSLSATRGPSRELSMRNKQVDQIIKKLSWLASKLRWNPRLRRMFAAECKREGCKSPHSLLRDVATRWDSTYNMIERALRVWDGIIAFTDRLDSQVPKDKRLRRSDAADLRKLVLLLKPLAEATLKFSVSAHPTIGEVVGMFEDLDKHFVDLQESEYEEEVWKESARRGHIIASKYYDLTGETNIYSLALLLHPNYRASYMEIQKWPEEWRTDATEQLRSVFEEYYQVRPQSSTPIPETQTESFAKLSATAQGLIRAAKQKQSAAQPVDVIEDWLDGLTAPGSDGSFVNPLQWWASEARKGNHRGGLTAMALDVFSCPGKYYVFSSHLLCSRTALLISS
ncbi:hypothetical protein CF326_g4862 [Tilletia indica]|nr:hypothetical protein CF326_g4862 [Tilletia indica]